MFKHNITKKAQPNFASRKTPQNKRFLVMRNTLILAIVVTFFSATIYVGRTLAQSWTEPQSGPPTPNVAAPIWNQNTTAQTGNFWITGNGKLNGGISLNGSASGTVTVQPAANVTSWTLTLPSAVGASGQCLQTSNATGTTIWGACGGGGLSGSGTLNYLSKFTPNGTTLGNSQIFDNGTNVGIGIGVPINKLDVRSSAANTFASIGSANSDASSYVFFFGGSSANDPAVSWTTGKNLRFGTGAYDASTYTEAMRINGSGYVGIGTTAPGNKLSVVTDTSHDDTLPALGANGGKFSLLNQNGKYGLLEGVLGTGNGFLQVQRVDATATAYDLLLQPTAGSVGIGTSTPNNLLQVAGLINFDDSHGNIFLGSSSGQAAYAGQYNVAVGEYTLSTGSGSQNIAIGVQALQNDTTGTDNVAIGYQSLGVNLSGHWNVAVGRASLGINGTGGGNAAIGWGALQNNTTGSSNTALGMYAGFNPLIYPQNVSNSTFVGYYANSSVDGITNSTAIGNGAQVTASNQVVIGNSSVTATKINGALNTTGAITQNGTAVCLANGTNCPSGTKAYAYKSVEPTCNGSTYVNGEEMGLNLPVTPTSTGKIRFLITGMLRNSTVGYRAGVQTYTEGSAYGCGTGYINLAGSPVGTKKYMYSSTASGRQGFALNAIIDLPVGSTTYLDVVLSAPDGGAAYIYNVDMEATEL